jgi:hypothetical protein
VTIRVSIKVKGARELKGSFDDAADRILVRSKRVLEDFAAPLIIEKARQELANKSKTKTGLLAGSLWDSGAKRRGNKAYIRLGWGYLYGSVLEFGPNKTMWEIRAKYKKALRIPLRTGVIYRKRVIHRWNSTMLREHYGPAIDAAWPLIETKLAEAMEL